MLGATYLAETWLGAAYAGGRVNIVWLPTSTVLGGKYPRATMGTKILTVILDG